ncbi:S-adenosyl-L-methionine-dependent methyltransferase [Flagelloscypha sp. PMI_526]|nr:S-adenosyl-L-methionine-dependent methyltransferase [Flagelloscypha sp. PMI_526]
MPSSNGITELANLVAIINENFNTIKEKVPQFPSINEPGFNLASEAFRKTQPEAAHAAKVIAAAANQLSTAVSPPFEGALPLLVGSAGSAAVRYLIQNNVTEILREAGPEGLHVDQIGAKASIDPKIVSRFLRLLASIHIYREVKPNVFTNNRISGLFDTGKSHADLIADPKAKHEGTVGLVAVLEHSLDQIKNSWEWLEQPENEYSLKRFSLGMRAANIFQSGGNPPILHALEWESLPKGSVVVDVGSGIGGMSLPLATAHPHLKVILQDRAPTLEEGKPLWNSKLPQALETGQVEFQAHDFFTPQKVQQPAVFFLKSILHDWSDAKVITILGHLRKAAGANTKLIIIDSIISHACAPPELEEPVEGATRKQLYPPPLLPNGGIPGTGTAYPGDIAMMAMLGGQERTLVHLQEVLKLSGWKLTQIKDLGSSLIPAIAIPT